MLQRLRLPRDNAPDDTETSAFQNYQGRTGLLFWGFRPYVIGGGTVLAVVLFGFGIYSILPEAEPIYRVVPNENVISTAVVVGTPDPLGSVPAAVASSTSDINDIIIPARIDNILGAGQRRAYVFNAEAGITWSIQVIVSNGNGPTVQLLGPDGSTLESASGNRDTALTITISQSGIHTLVLDDTRSTGSTYTLWILPV